MIPLYLANQICYVIPNLPYLLGLYKAAES